MKIIIKQEREWHRPYIVNEKEIEKIIIYKDGKILINVHRGCLENVNEKFESSYDSDIREITIDGEVKSARKENLNRKDNYLLRGRRTYSFDRGYILYIYVTNIFSEYSELPKVKYNSELLKVEYKDYFLYGYKVEMKYSSMIHDHYLKYYEKNENIDPEDRHKTLEHPFLKDSEGNLIKTPDGKEFVRDEDRYYCLRAKNTWRKDFIIYNGLYIKEGK